MTGKTLIQAALGYLSIRIRSKKELIDYLSQRTQDEDILAKAVQYLETNHLIDDIAFAKAWIESRLRHGKGDRLISLELHQKGVASEIVREQLGAISDITWEESANVVLNKYQSKWAHISGYQKKAKMYQTFTARGYSSSRIDAFLRHRVE